VYIHISIHKSCYFLTTNHLKNWQYHLKLSGMHQRLIQNRNIWIRHKNMKKVHYYKVTRRGGRTHSPWRANTAPCPVVVRRGERMASRLCSLSRCSSPWRVMTVFCREVRFLTPKTQFSSNLNPKFDRKLNLWSFYNLNTDNIQFYGLSTLINNQFLHVLSSNSILNPNSQIHMNNNILHAKFSFRII